MIDVFCFSVFQKLNLEYKSSIPDNKVSKLVQSKGRCTRRKVDGAGDADNIAERESENSANDYLLFTFNEILKLIENRNYSSVEAANSLSTINIRISYLRRKKVILNIFSSGSFQELVMFFLGNQKELESKQVIQIIYKICQRKVFPFQFETTKMISNYLFKYNSLFDFKEILEIVVFMAIYFPEAFLQFEEFFYQGINANNIEKISEYIQLLLLYSLKCSEFDYSLMIRTISLIMNENNLIAKLNSIISIKIAVKNEIMEFINFLKTDHWFEMILKLRDSNIHSCSHQCWKVLGYLSKYLTHDIISSDKFLNFKAIIKQLSKKNSVFGAYIQIAIFVFLKNVINNDPLIIDILIEQDSHEDENSIIMLIKNHINSGNFDVKNKGLDVLLAIIMKSSASQIRYIGILSIVEILIKMLLTVEDGIKLSIIHCLNRIINSCNATLGDNYNIQEIFSCFEFEETINQLFESENKEVAIESINLYNFVFQT